MVSFLITIGLPAAETLAASSTCLSGSIFKAPEIQLSLDLNILGQRLVAKKFRLQNIFPGSHLVYNCLSLDVAQGILVGLLYCLVS